jgi:hypothetical protein
VEPVPIPTKRQTPAELIAPTRAAQRPLPTNEIPFAFYKAVLHRFPGIQSAVRAAKLPDPSQYREWTRDDVIGSSRFLRDITGGGGASVSLGVASAVYGVFGTLETALAEAKRSAG